MSSPVHYTAKILPDGHLPLPKAFRGRAGDDVEVTVSPVNGGHTRIDVPEEVKSEGGGRSPRPKNEDELGQWQRDNALRELAGIGRSGLSDISVNHDQYLYGKRGLKPPSKRKPKAP